MEPAAVSSPAALCILIVVGSSLTALGSCAEGDVSVPPANSRLETVCEELRYRTCEAMAACCSVAAFSYDADSCSPALWDDCESSVRSVESGELTFAEERIEPCIEQLTELYGKCLYTAAEAQWAVELIAPACRQIFDGTLDEGEPCDATKGRYCRQFTERGVTYCTPQGSCTALPGKGQSCLASDLYSQCQPPLYCRTEPSEPEGQGVCDETIAPGAVCDPALAISRPCGPGHVCDSASLTCVAQKEPGTSCDSAYECRSTACSDNVCGSVPAIVISAECSG